MLLVVSPADADDHFQKGFSAIVNSCLGELCCSGCQRLTLDSGHRGDWPQHVKNDGPVARAVVLESILIITCAIEKR